MIVGTTVASHRSFRLATRSDAVLSSRSTSFHKRWLPVLLAAYPVLVLSATVLGIAQAGRVTPTDIVFLVAACLVLAVGYRLFRSFSCRVVDEVVDDGASLIIRNNGIDERVSLANVEAVLDGPVVRPVLITLRLGLPCRFGREVTFMPRYRFTWNDLHPLVDELRTRVAAAKAGQLSREEAWTTARGDPWASWFRLYRDFFLPFLLLPALVGIVGVTSLLLPDLAGVVGLGCGLLWAWTLAVAMRAHWRMFFWPCPRCKRPFRGWQSVRVFSDNRCYSCGVRAGDLLPESAAGGAVGCSDVS